jgi:alkylation response protein AidB-like acyl-CoA dehydrogenase
MVYEQSNTLPTSADFLTKVVSEQEIFVPEQFLSQQKILLRTAYDFFTKEVLPKIEDIERAEPGVLRNLIQQAGKRGLLKAVIPRRYGGLEEGIKTNALLCEQFAQQQSFFATWAVQVGVSTLPIMYFANDELKARYLPGLADGSLIGSYAVTEAEAGSDVMSIKTSAVLTQDGRYYILNGSKKWITNAGLADIFTVLAKVDGIKLTEFVVEAHWDGVSIGPEAHTMGITGSSHPIIYFNNVQVPLQNRLWDVGVGLRVVSSTMTIGRLQLAVGCAGISRAALNYAIEHTLERYVFGRPLSDLGLVQEKLAYMVADIYAIESIAFRAIGLIDDCLADLKQRGKATPSSIQAAIETFTIEASIAKVFGSEASGRVIDEALQLFGGSGYVQGHPVERAYRDIRGARIYEGTNEINRLLISGTLFRRIFSHPETMTGQSLSNFHALLPLIEEEILNGYQAPTGFPELEEAIKALEKTKRVAIYTVIKVAKKLLTTLEQEHEFLGTVADVLISIYAIDSTLARALSAVRASSKEAHMHVLVANLVTSRYLPQLRNRIYAMQRVISTGKELAQELEKLDTFLGIYDVDTISMQRDFAAMVIKRRKYPFFALLDEN